VLRFDCFAANGVVAAGEEKEEGRKLLQTHLLLGRTRRHYSCAQKTSLILFWLAEVVPCNFRLFWG
jgi:hypothetical protein